MQQWPCSLHVHNLMHLTRHAHVLRLPMPFGVLSSLRLQHAPTALHAHAPRLPTPPFDALSSLRLQHAPTALHAHAPRLPMPPFDALSSLRLQHAPTALCAQIPCPPMPPFDALSSLRLQHAPTALCAQIPCPPMPPQPPQPPQPPRRRRQAKIWDSDMEEGMLGLSTSTSTSQELVDNTGAWRDQVSAKDGAPAGAAGAAPKVGHLQEQQMLPQRWGTCRCSRWYDGLLR